ncbi:MAG: glycerophosphodiester phosphodiesterase family protein [Bacteroidota bacterium]
MDRPAPDAAPEAATTYVFDLQGHRGARGLVPENTVPSFRRALELGVTTLEMDAAVSSDGVVVVSHEPWMNPAICTQPDGSDIPEGEGRAHNLYQMTYEEIAAYDCGSKGNPRFPEQTPMAVSKPRLVDVIEMAEAYVAEHGLAPIEYNIETKSTPDGDGLFHPGPADFAQALYDVLAETGIRERAIIQSFDPRTLREARVIDPSVRLALLIAESLDQGVAQNLEQLGFTPAIYSPQYTLIDEALVEAVHTADMRLIPWTINDAETMRRLLELGVDGIITDYPNIGAALLRSE